MECKYLELWEASLSPNGISNKDSCCCLFFFPRKLSLLSPGETETLRYYFCSEVLAFSSCFVGFDVAAVCYPSLTFRHATINLASALFGNECLLRAWGMIETYTSIQRVNRSKMIENTKPGVKHSPEF